MRNWLGGIVGQSDPTSTVRFFPGQTMTGGTIPISNNLTGQQFNHSNSAAPRRPPLTPPSPSVETRSASDGTAPAITLDAMQERL